MSQLAVANNNTGVTADGMLKVIAGGDLSGLNSADKITLYMESCRDLGLNWRTKPFALGKVGQGNAEQLYLTVDGADQLAALHNVSIVSLEERESATAYRVKMTVALPSGRQMIKTGGVDIKNLQGQALENARMKAESKAWRRAVRAIVGMNTYAPPDGRTFFDPADVPDPATFAAVVMAGEDDELEPDPPEAVTVHVDYRDGKTPARNVRIETGEITEAQTVQLSALQILRRQLHSVGKMRGLTDPDEYRALAVAYEIDLDVATEEELTKLIQALLDDPDARAAIQNSVELRDLKRSAQ